ncbi:MAG: helix-turn-helix domain-containing protein [Actinobacteria bacterium]|nr:helix-turn-helix domain-containing protein [Actinomycetota bacterium]MCL5736471.1 helix-turn-helix domain-containing protein [Actinomycetota bacterium]
MLDDRYHVEALARGLAVLNCFSDGPAKLTLSELCARLNMEKTTAYRVLYTLQTAGYIRQDADTKRYSLTLKVFDLQAASLAALEFPKLAQPLLEELNSRLQESVSMGILDESRVRYVARVPFKRLIAINIQVGSTLPAHATSMGKALLAALDTAEVRALYSDRILPTYTPRTIATVDALLDCLATVRAQGFAVAEEELENGLYGVAVPVRGRDGAVVAAISMSTSAVRASRAHLYEECLPAILDTAAEISRLLGHYEIRSGSSWKHG